MMLELAKNPLRIQQGIWRRQDVGGESLQALAGQYMQGDGFAVIWQMHRVIWGRWEGGALRLSDGSPCEDVYVLEARFFNDREELHLCRKERSYIGRYICDGEGGDSCEYVDSLSRLWGEAASSGREGFVALADTKRFIYMDIPAEGGSRYYDLITRNYVGVHEETGQAGYVDFRFKAVVPEGGGENE